MSRKSMILASALTLIASLALVAAGGEKSAEATLPIEGMTCGSCATAIQSALEKIEGVKEAKVVFETGQAQIVFDPDRAGRDQFLAAIENLGYRVGEGDAASASQSAAASSCSTAEPTATAGSSQRMPDVDFKRVVEYATDTILASADSPKPLSRSLIQEATGVEIPLSEVQRLQAAVIANLQERNPELLAKLSSEGAGRCAEYDACSLHGDLSGATGEQLAMYQEEKRSDGERFDDFPLPEFQALDLGENIVLSTDLRGKPTVMAFLAGHCTHSIDSIPILQETIRTFGERGLRVVGVLVNSGSPEDVNEWMAALDPEFEVWVYNDASIGDLVESHLVPTWIYIDSDGAIQEKLVGFKDGEVVRSWISDLLEP